MKALRIQHVAYKLTSFLLLAVVVFSSPAFAESRSEPSLEESRESLDGLRKAVAEVAKQLKDQRTKQSRLTREVQQHDIELAKTAKEQFQLAEQANQLKQQRLELQSRQATLSGAIEDQREAIAAQVVAAYHMREHNQIVQWLSQKNPVEARRHIEALGVISKHTDEKLKAFEASLSELQTVEKTLEETHKKITANLRETRANEIALQNQRDTRLQLLAKLDVEIASNEKRQAQNISNEKALESLVSSLEINAEIQAQKEKIARDNIATLPRSPGKTSGFSGKFSQAKGKLYWPLEGKQITRFGSTRPGTRARAQGVTIAGDEGEPVHSVFSGVVIFADYLPAQGMLMIIDHGEDYWSLYSHNESLLSNVGDYVAEGQTIATVGASGGQKSPSLYFEIRRKGEPTNPAQWCQKT